MKNQSDKNSATSAVAGFAGVIDDAILPPAGVIEQRERTTEMKPVYTCNSGIAAKVESEAIAALKDVGVAELIAQPVN